MAASGRARIACRRIARPTARAASRDGASWGDGGVGRPVGCDRTASPVGGTRCVIPSDGSFFRLAADVEWAVRRTLRLLTDLLDLPAHVIAELYRQRWQVELFFRWFKVSANFKHLTSHSRNGIALGFHIAVIACLLMCLRTQKPLSSYAYNLLALVGMGMGEVEDIIPLLENRERERQRDRARQAKKRTQKKIA